MIHPASEALRPQQPGPGLPFIGAVVVHMAIGAAMVLAVHRPIAEEPVVQAELWSSLPPLQPATATAPQESPAPEPVTVPVPLASPDIKTEAAAPESDIALEKKRIEEDRQRQEQEATKARVEKERLAQQKAIAEKLAREKAAQDKAAKDKAEKAALEEAARQAAIAKQRAAEELKRRTEEERLAKKRAEDEKRQRQAELKKALAQQRREQEDAILRGFGSDPKAKEADAGRDRTTKAGVSGGAEIGDRSGVLADYSAAIRARIRARITFDPARAPNNPEVIFEVTQLATGQITKVTLQKSSGNPAWDAAVERAIQASNPLPKAADGLVEPLLILSFRPQDPR